MTGTDALQAADPNLRIIRAGRRRRSRLSQRDWDRAEGVACPKCGGEALRLADGMCNSCWNVADAVTVDEMEDKSMRAYYSRELRKGTISVTQMREGRLAGTQ